MPDKLFPVPLRQLLSLILHELDSSGSVFGIPQELFFVPGENEVLKTDIFGHQLHSPLGVAAGPHTQMAQNIVVAWLMGARYIELKTIQTLDELEIPKPCIDMQDEGYNCEWSQELKIKDSYSEYLNAWIIIHILNRRLGLSRYPGTVFNMSVGYDMKGIMSDNVQWFLDKMSDCSEDLDLRKEEILDICPFITELEIPSVISDNITLSTMHGCPAYEIGDIASYLLGNRKLHTMVKLNPTLLGPEILRNILNNRLKFRITVPDEAFAHDLNYPDAVRIIKSLRETAAVNRLHFGLKLTNTLETVNNKTVFSGDVGMMYMSGRALHPLTVNLARKLQEEFSGKLLLSFSGGADAFNISRLISCGFRTITTCTDILKPGGYMRLHQYFKELDRVIQAGNAQSIDGFIVEASGVKNIEDAALSNLSRYSDEVLNSKYYRREYIKPPDIKSDRPLSSFDCISAPCRDACATGQDIPWYLWFASKGDTGKALEIILDTNPFPNVTGMVCDHLCQYKCTRVNYDDPLMIREVKRYISVIGSTKLKSSENNGIKVAVIGAGPSGLSCAYYLRMTGFAVDVFEERSKAGGMVQYAIPGFRLTDEAVEKDIGRITGLGVAIHYDSRITRDKFDTLRKEYPFIYIGSGAQLSAPFSIEGARASGVTDPLQFLFKARRGEPTGIGKNVVIIGGGNTAMDAARTAQRLVGQKGKVTIIYRRTINEMPADQGEIKAVMEEGIEIKELAAPEKVMEREGKVAGLICCRMELRGRGKDGRPEPLKVAGSTFEVACNTIIPAIGQLTDIDFAAPSDLKTSERSFKTRIEGVYIGGDAMRGASTAINAVGDGRKAALEIIQDSGMDFNMQKPDYQRNLTAKDLIIKRSERIFADGESMEREAARCLWCDEMCGICTTVCPNLANRSYETTPLRIMLQKAGRSENGSIEIRDDTLFEIKQKHQILNIASLCNECGNCSTFCPTAGAPYRDKPRFYMTVSSFNKAEEGYYLAVIKDRKNLIYKNKDIFVSLSETPDNYLFETDYVRAALSKLNFTLSEVTFRTPCMKEAHFRQAAEMAVLLRGAEELLHCE